MSAPQDSTYPEDWLRIARRDGQRVHVILRGGDVELAAFLLQQCPEKYLKAYLLARGWKLQRTHELDMLLDAACRFDSGLEAYQELCERVAGFYLMERYPLLGGGGAEVDDLAADIPPARLLILALHPGEAPELGA